MGQTKSAARYRALGDELRKYREDAGLSLKQLAELTGWSASKVWRIEIGWTELSTVDVIYYLGECGYAPVQIMDLLAEFRDAAHRKDYWLTLPGPWLEESVCELIFHEATASASVCYEPQLIPGLLQTESYARAMIGRYDSRTPEGVEVCLRARLERQQILQRPTPAQFTFFVHEHALRAVVDDPAVMQEQLLSLMLLDGAPHISVRVVPGSALFGGAFRLFQFKRFKDLVYLDAYIGGLFVEDREYVDQYRALIPVIADIALDEGQSRLFIADLADRYDRGSARNRVEEEQL
jgi:transcriptional regulator with XRE-family HTH domain